jgi:16S rRNA (uracil1498-N3)-methyltransferase
MRLHRFYVAGKIPPQGIFDVVGEGLLNQLKRVLRLKIGYEVTVFNGDGQDHECLIREFLKDKIVLELKKSYASRFMPDREIWLCASIVKKDNFEWTVEKATELGVSHIIPILSDRSEKKSLNIERLEKIIIEASEQSGRGNVPTIYPIMKLNEAIDHIRHKFAAGTLEVLAFHVEGELLRDNISYKDKSIALFIGPEGGWSEKEVDLFHKNNIPLKCLGRQILRAETAVVAALANIVFT